MARKEYQSIIPTKPSGIDWIGDIPNDWKIKPFKALFRASQKRVKDDPSVTQLLSVSGYRGVERKNISSFEGQMPSEDIQNYRIVEKGQLAVNTMWLNYAGLGVSDYEGYVSPAYCAYHIKDDLGERFAHYLLRSPLYVQKYSSLLYGIRPNSLQVKQYDFEKIEILLPPKETQEKIVVFLDEKTAVVDAVIARKKRLIGLLKEKRSSIITHAVTKGLDPSTPTKPSGIDWIGDILSEWNVVPMKELFKDRKKLVGRDFEKYTLLRLSKEGVFPKQESDSGKNPAVYDAYQVFEKDDLVFCTFDYDVTPRTIGHVQQAGMLTGAYTRLIPKENVASRYYYYYYYALDIRKDLLHLCTGLRNALSSHVFWNLPTPKPSKETQEKIVAFLDEKTKQIDDTVATIERQIGLLNEYRASLIYHCVTGKISI